MKASNEDRETDRTPQRESRAKDGPESEPAAAAHRAPTARPFSLSTAQRFQSAAGNRALAGMIAQRRATTTAPAAPGTPATAEPATTTIEPDPAPKHDLPAPAQSLASPDPVHIP